MPPDEPAGRPPSEAASPESPRSRRGRRARAPAPGPPGGLAPRADSEGETLTVARGISCSGRIESCERLMVEGTVETEIHDCRFLADGKTGQGSFPSIHSPGAFSNAGRAAEAPLSFGPREIPPGPAAAISRSGAAPGARRGSRTFAFTIYGTAMPVMQC